jgi:hypothetical protein
VAQGVEPACGQNQDAFFSDGGHSRILSGRKWLGQVSKSLRQHGRVVEAPTSIVFDLQVEVVTVHSVTILWCAAQVKVYLALAAPVYLAARRQHGGREIITWGGETMGSLAFYAPSDRTVLSQAKPGLIKAINDPDAAAPPAEAARR